MSQLLDSAGTIGTIVATFVIVLGVIWHIQSGPDDDIGKELAAPWSHPNQAAVGDDLRRRIEAIEEKLEIHRKHIIQTERRLRGAGVFIFALICAIVSLYAFFRNDWAPGICFLAMALLFGAYGLVNVFGAKSSRQISANNRRSPT